MEKEWNELVDLLRKARFVYYRSLAKWEAMERSFSEKADNLSQAELRMAWEGVRAARATVEDDYRTLQQVYAAIDWYLKTQEKP